MQLMLLADEAAGAYFSVSYSGGKKLTRKEIEEALKNNDSSQLPYEDAECGKNEASVNVFNFAVEYLLSKGVVDINDEGGR